MVVMNVTNNKLQLQGQRGFTLVEIMVALVVFMIIMLGVAAGLITTIRTNKANVVRDEAVRLATDDLNRLKGASFTLNGTSGDLNAGGWTTPTNVLVNMRAGATQYARSVQITDINATATALKRIDVAVGWDDLGGGPAIAPTNRNRQVSLSTIIVRNDAL